MEIFEERVGVREGTIRIIPCHHFTSQDVFSMDKAPGTSMTGAEGKLVVWSGERLEVRDLDRRGQLLHCLPSPEVRHLAFCPAANFLLALCTDGSVLAFLNWWVSPPESGPLPRPAGIPPTPLPPPSQLDIVEVSSEPGSSWIACCKSTSCVALSNGTRISVFYLTSHQVGDSSYPDFKHLLDVVVPFVPTELAICENVISCLSDEELLVFQLAWENTLSAFPSSHTKESYNPHCLEWKFEFSNEEDFRHWNDYIQNQISEDSFPLAVSAPPIEKANKLNRAPHCPTEIRGPLINVPGLDIRVEADSTQDCWSHGCQKVVLLYRKFSKSALHSLQLVPVYVADSSSLGTDPLHAAATKDCSNSTFPLCSSKFQHLKGMGCFFSGPQKGFLFNVVGKTDLLSTYTYTAPLKNVVLEPEFLYVLSEYGLETYTTRLMHSVLKELNPPSVCPDAREAICLVSLCPFLGVERMVECDNYIVLMSSPQERGDPVTLYSLRKPTSQELYQDLLEVALSNKLVSMPAYIHLLSEAHVILRTHLQAKKKPVAEMFKESCLLMANYFLDSDLTPDRDLAVPYYVLSEEPIDKVLAEMLKIQRKTEREDILNTHMVKYVIEMILHQNAPCKNSEAAAGIIDLFIEHAPDKLWRLLLFSDLKLFEEEKVMSFLKKRHRMASITDTFTIIALLFMKGELDSSTSMLLSLKNHNLVPFLTTVTELLWNPNLTPLGRLILQHKPNAFLELLVGLVQKRGHHCTPQKAFDLVKEFCCGEEDTLLRKTLIESLLSSKQLCAPELVMELVQIYLSNLQRQVKFQPVFTSVSQKKVENLFAPRPTWLNEMAPFYGRCASERCNLRPTCICLKCTEDLVKLQSLLGSKFCSEEVKQLVLSSTKADFEGYLSLKILTLDDRREAVTLLLHHCPPAAYPFLQDQAQDDLGLWCHLYRELQLAKQQDEGYTRLNRTLTAHLAEILDLETFMELEPGDPRALRRCYERNQANIIREKIIALGREVKAVM